MTAPNPATDERADLARLSANDIEELKAAAQEYEDSAHACDTPALRPFRRRRNLRAIALRDAAERISHLLDRLRRGAEDTARLDWLEAHDYGLTCWNVPDAAHRHWVAPMEPNAGWTVGDGTDDDVVGALDDSAGKTARDAIDWAMKQEGALREPAACATTEQLEDLLEDQGKTNALCGHRNCGLAAWQHSPGNMWCPLVNAPLQKFASLATPVPSSVEDATVCVTRLRELETVTHFVFEVRHGDLASHVMSRVTVERRAARESLRAAWWASRGNSAMAAKEALRWAEDRAREVFAFQQKAEP